MSELTQDSIVLQTIALLSCYGFEIKGKTTDRLVERWLEKYTPIWLRLATIEALYLGRYKAISVEHILTTWLRKGNPSYHFNHDFERLICRKLPEYLQNIYANSLQENNNLNKKPSQNPIQFSQPIIQETEKQQELLASFSKRKTKTIFLNLERETFKVETKNKAKISKNSPIIHKQPNWISTSKVQKSIERFTPLPDRSQFYLKLKAVAKQNLKQQV